MPRSLVSLNGSWDFAPLVDLDPIEHLPEQPGWATQPVQTPSSWRWSINPAAEYQPYDLFGYPADWNAVEAGLLRRAFSATRRAGERAWLVFDGILQRAVIFVNGQKAAYSTESYLPVEVDVTDLLVDGQNEVVVWCGPYERIDTPMGKKVLAPCGSWFAGLARGLWQDVNLAYRPEIAITETVVRTFTRSEEIEVEAVVENFSGMPFTGLLRWAIQVDGAADRFLAEQAMQLAAGERQVVSLRQTWRGAHWWSPEDPYLYHLCGELTSDGQPVDRSQTRFGFREVWWEDHRLMLNGVRVNLRGDAWHYQGFVMQTSAYARNWYRLCRETGINFVRLHAMPYPSFFLDEADESGMLIIDESAIYGSGKAMQADHPVFIANSQAHLQALVRRDRNHPSVILWSMQNEMRWVDGREGYLQAIPALTAAMKALDPTRAISYDGDNRLVPAQDCEIISMHYNIDGTVAGWDQRKPLIFGEHGAFHYVSPQVSSRFGGPAAYRSFERAMEAIAYQERLFIEYARRQAVTGLTPFNMINYSLWTFPEREVMLDWADPAAPGPKPKRIPADTLTVDNGLLAQASDALAFRPAAAWQQLQAAFKAVRVIADEYNSAFFGGQPLARNFSIYNDTLQAASVRLVFCWQIAGQVAQAGEAQFVQQPGERHCWHTEFALPDVSANTRLSLSVTLYHADQVVDQGQWEYSLYPAMLKETPVASGQGVLYLGGGPGLAIVRQLLPAVQAVDQLDAALLKDAHALVIGDRNNARIALIRPLLEDFAARGGSILVLEQENFTLGDLALSDRSFPLAWMTDPEHPVFAGLSESDLRYWCAENPTAPGAVGISLGAFIKPQQGDLRILLECGDGDFGWGGLLWTPLVEVQAGAGRVLLNQMDVCRSFDSVPAACVLLRNLLAYACTARPPRSKKTVQVLGAANSLAFLQSIGLKRSPDGAAGAAKDSLWVVAPGELLADQVERLRLFAQQGGTLFILPASPQDSALLSRLVGQPVVVTDGALYQVRTVGHALSRGISDVDLFHIERVTYTPAGHDNRLVCQYALQAPAGGASLFENVPNPWEEFFLQGKDGEYQKIAVATRSQRQPFEHRVYGVVLPVGKGQIILCQILAEAGNEKVQRVYARLLANLGAEIESRLLSFVREKKDFAIDTWMGLPQESYQDLQAMEQYFTAPAYVLNNLGEGVYGWMKRLERRDGVVTIPNSAGRVCFLSVFVASEINRDPSKRAGHELPDSSIVPDLFVEANCACRLFVNGRLVGATTPQATGSALKIDDVVLNQGINRLVVIAAGGPADIQLNAWFLNKYGDPVGGLHYQLTLD